MSRISRPAAAVAIVAALALAVPAQGVAATPLERKVAQLTRQVTTLQRQVRTLQNQVRALNGGLGAAFAGATCSAAITADTLQGTWTAIDARMQSLGQQPIFGAQQPVNDFGNCGLLQQPNVPRAGIVNPPTIAAFNPLLAWLRIEA
jgi:hypothetical protein